MTASPTLVVVNGTFGGGGGGEGMEGGKGNGNVQFFSWSKLPLINTPMQSFSSDADQEECQKMETALSCVKVRNALRC